MPLDLTDYVGGGAASASSIFGLSLTMIIIFVVLILLLKGFALWKAARLDEKVWFWILLITSTMGILPLIYLILKRKKKA